jgi:hypothetical protein
MYFKTIYEQWEYYRPKIISFKILSMDDKCIEYKIKTLTSEFILRFYLY